MKIFLFVQIYWVGPIVGGIMATVIYYVIFDLPDAKRIEEGK